MRLGLCGQDTKMLIRNHWSLRGKGIKEPRPNSWDPLEQQGFQGELEPARRRRIKIKYGLPDADKHTQKNISHNAQASTGTTDLGPQRRLKLSDAKLRRAAYEVFTFLYKLKAAIRDKA